jgi:hypothetical protein
VHYAATNAFLDALAVKRSAQGSSTLSVRFGPFSGSGMIGTEEERHLERVGLGCLNPGSLLTVLHRLVAASTAGLSAVNGRAW